MNEKNTNNSNDCLFECKELMRKHISSSSLNINCEDTLSVLTEEIDVDKFKAWFDRNINTFKSKQNIQTYFNRAFHKELEKGTFKLEEVGWNATTLFQALRERGVKVIQDDTCYICVMWEAYARVGVKIETVQELNHKIVDFMKEGQTTQDYIDIVKKSKTLSEYNIDWDKVQETYEKEIAEWHRILDELSAIGGGDND